MFRQKPDNLEEEPTSKDFRFYKVALCIYPFVLLFSLENMKPEKGFFFLLTGYGSIFTGLLVVAVNYFLFFAVVFLFYGLLKNMFATSVVVGSVLFLFYGINYYRWVNTGFVFTPYDLAFAGRLFSLASFAVIKPDGKTALAFVAIVLCCAFFYLHREVYRRGAARGKKRLAIVLGSVFFLGVILLPVGKSTLNKILKIEPAALTQYHEKLYTSHGSLLSFLFLMEGQKAVKPSLPTASPPEQPPLTQETAAFNPEALAKGYSPQQMEKVLQEVSQIPLKGAGFAQAKPNVIVVMSEAFWDPANLEAVEFSAEPLPNFNRLAQENKAGNILTPAIGGLTSNVEYELLLMDSMMFYGPGVVPFERANTILPEEDRLALPWQFKQNGYHTVALHPYDRNFYNRGVLYPRLGFDEFIARDSMPEAPLSGEFISDEYFTQRIIQEMEAAEDPLFLFGISMENHYPYDPYRYREREIQVSSQRLKMPQMLPLNTYTQGVHNADAALGQLVAYLETQTEPTLLLFYGDHLPILENRPLAVYEESGYISTAQRDQWAMEDKQKMYNTPYLLWSNFEIETVPFGDISPLFAGPVLLDAAGLAMSDHAAYVLDSMAYFNGIHKEVYINGNGQYQPLPPENGMQRLESLYYIHLDRFEPGNSFGQRYAYEELRAVSDSG